MRRYRVQHLELIANNFSWIRGLLSNMFRNKHFLDYSDSSIDHVINEMEKTVIKLKQLRVKGGE